MDTAQNAVVGLQLAVCPFCHTDASVSESTLEAAGGWQCRRCGQRWDRRRLATAAAYGAWVAEQDARTPPA